MSSDLSVSAKEFVPKSSCSLTLSASAAEFIPEDIRKVQKSFENIRPKHSEKCSISKSSSSNQHQNSSYQEIHKDTMDPKDKISVKEFHLKQGEKEYNTKKDIKKSKMVPATYTDKNEKPPQLSWSSIVKKLPSSQTIKLSGNKTDVSSMHKKRDINTTSQTIFKNKGYIKTENAKNYKGNLKTNISKDNQRYFHEQNSEKKSEDLKCNLCSSNENQNNFTKKENFYDNNNPQSNAQLFLIEKKNNLPTTPNSLSRNSLKKTDKKKSSNLRVSFNSSLQKQDEKSPVDDPPDSASSCKELIKFNKEAQTPKLVERFGKSMDVISSKEITFNPAIDVPISTAAPTLSYSSVVKKVMPISSSSIERSKDDEKPKLSELTPEEKKIKMKMNKLKRKIKAREKKALTKGDVKKVETNTPKKQSQKEVMLDFGSLLDQLASEHLESQKMVNKKKQRKVVSTGVVSVVAGLAKRNTLDGKRKVRDKYGGTQNLLDSTAPVIKRGKERETPKKKKPTLLKKIIKRERERKRLNNLTKQDPEKEKSSALSNDLTTTLNNKCLSVKDEVTEVSDATVENSCLSENSIAEVCQESIEIKKETVSQNITDTNPSENGPNVVKLCSLPEYVREKIHSRKFREYCNHLLSEEINNLTQSLLLDLIKYQDRVYHENRTKFKQKRRYVLGLREVLKHLKVKKLKAIIVAPNIERISCEGGIDDYLTSIISLCNEDMIPIIFALNRHTLGKTMKKNAPASVVGIFNYDGAQEKFKELMLLVEKAHIDYKNKVKLTTQEFTNELKKNENIKMWNKKELPKKSSRYRQLNTNHNEQMYFVYPGAPPFYQDYHGYHPIKNNFFHYSPGQTNYYYHTQPPSVLHFDPSSNFVRSSMNPSLQITEAEYLKNQMLEKFYS